ncbi:Arc family DNA-binding protein [Mesorhizobium sp. B3-1-7]|uniref:FitA-like ribbon-helix-helix domain-containing protein n=1 Tax=Mesorhizobium sp. B3-1-7 TaxID=2589894 RepID=UPI00112A1D24|nr:Arc family DNA-binding protein [Mesorhizobium sp. B3-1-7]TPI58658.1 Arc family DNA-binding protein [Mesorhizobium sp. B3-1-7]
MPVTDLKIRLPADLKKRLVERASNNDRSTAAEALNILRTALKTEEDRSEPA